MKGAWRKQKITGAALLAVIFCTVTVQTLTPFIPQASAISYSEAESRTREYTLYTAFQACLTMSRGGGLAMPDAASPENIFPRTIMSTKVTVGYLAGGNSGGTMECKDVSVQMAKILGFSNNEDYFKMLGFELANNGTIWTFRDNKTAPWTASSNIQSYASSKGVPTSEPGYAQYYMINSALDATCGRQIVGPYDSIQEQQVRTLADTNGEVNNTRYFSGPVFDKVTNTSVRNIMKMDNNHWDERTFAYPRADNSSGEVKCRDLVKDFQSSTDKLTSTITQQKQAETTDAYVTAAITALCGKNPTVDIPTPAYKKWADCASPLRDRVTKCLTQQKAAVNPKTLAQCVNPSKAKELTDAFTKAKTSIDANQQECPAGQVKKDGKCVKEDTTTSGETKGTCNIPDLGWIICPVVTLLASISDGVKVQLDKFLMMPTSYFSSAGEVSTAWGRMRDYANIFFVLGFLVIVYSQITGAGISNYGVKKLLPKLIVVAILVNASLPISLIAVDLSNIVGAGSMDIIAKAVPTPSANGGGTFSQIAGGAILLTLGGVAAYFLLASLIGLLISVVVVGVVTVFLLGARQALIILLVVVSPLAFASVLLPNTEVLYKKWFSMFKTLLVLYPIVGVLYGAGKLASNVIVGSNIAESTLLGLIGASMTVLPMVAVPTLVKKSLAGIGNLSGMAGKLEGRMSGGLNKKAQERIGESRYGQTRQYRKQQGIRRRAMIRAGTYKNDKSVRVLGKEINYGKLDPRNLTSKVNAAANNSALTGRVGDKLANAGATLEQQELEEDKKAVTANIARSNLTHTERLTIAKGGAAKGISGKSLAARMAAQEAVVATGDSEQLNELINHASRNLNATNDTDALQLNHLADIIQRSPNKPAYVQPGDLESMRHHGAGETMSDSSGMIRSALDSNVYSAEKQTSTGRQEMGIVRAELDKMNTETGGTFEYKDPSGKVTENHFAGARQFVKNAHQAMNDPQLNRQLGKQREMVERSSRGNFKP